MCGRFSSRTPAADLAEYFGVDEVVAPELGARYNVAPTDETYAVAESRDARRLGTFRWGLIPFWAKDVKVGAKMINARAEGLIDKPAFRRAFERKRCIVPADGFYEWERVGAKRKQPWYITRGDGEPMGPEMGHYAMVDGGSSGLAGGLGQAGDGDGPRVTFYVSVPDLRKTLDQAVKLGGKILMEPTEIPGVVTLAMFADPDGNAIGLTKA